MRYKLNEKCPHCGDRSPGDHSCTCPYTDQECPDHFIRTCTLPPKGWWCAGAKGHTGPCPTRAKWWNLQGRKWERGCRKW